MHEDLLTSGLISEVDDTFSITVRKLRQLSKVAGAANRIRGANNDMLDERILNEKKIVAEVTRLFILEKLYSYALGNFEEHQKDIMKIVLQEFHLD